MPRRKDADMTDQPEVDIDLYDVDPHADAEIDDYSIIDPDIDPEVESEAPQIAHHPDLIEGYDRYDYVAVDGQTLVAEFKFDDGSGIKAWTRDQGRLYTTRHIAKAGHAVLLSGRARVSVDEVNAEIEGIAAGLESADD